MPFQFSNLKPFSFINNYFLKRRILKNGPFSETKFDFRQSPPVKFKGVKEGQDEVKLNLPNPNQNPLLSKLRKNQVTNVDGRIGFFFIDLKKRPSITRM